MGRELIQELLDVALRKVETQGDFTTDPGAIEEIVDEVIDEFMRDGLIDDDEDTTLLKSELVARLTEQLKNK